MNKKMYILCGLPGSGKSQWCKDNFPQMADTFYINRDDFRSSLFMGTYTFNKDYESIIDHGVAQMTVKAMAKGVSVIIDETNITVERRAAWIFRAKVYGYEVEIIYFIPSKYCLGNRMLNSRGNSREKWESVINGMLKRFEEPTDDEALVTTIEVKKYF